MPKPKPRGAGSDRRGGDASSSASSSTRKGGAVRPLPARKRNDKPLTQQQPSSPSPDRRPQQRQQQHPLPFALQQRLLDVFAHTLGATLASPRLQEALQAVKRALFERDFAGAFGGGGDSKAEAETEDAGLPPLLDAYAARWSPTRALCYAAILSSPLVQEHWRGSLWQKQQEEEEEEEEEKKTLPSSTATVPRSPFRMVALGGAAAEIVAFGALLAMAGMETVGDADETEPADGTVVLVDSGPWASVVDRLHTGLAPGRKTEQDAGTDAEADADAALVQPADRLRVDVRQLDLLSMDDLAMAALFATTEEPPCPPAPALVTLFFTLNELFTAGGLGAAATFLLRLTAAAPPATVLLVVDSPGSYAETAVGAAKMRRYPMQWLLDKILLQGSGGSDSAGDGGGNGTDDAASSNSWTKVHQDEAVWFRLPPSLRYPIRLEDMRYQVHLYVRR